MAWKPRNEYRVEIKRWSDPINGSIRYKVTVTEVEGYWWDSEYTLTKWGARHAAKRIIKDRDKKPYAETYYLGGEK